ncbi:hypothetical protein GMMP15_1030065 [Candidatus Magnetomoraceae bacterium gMMP-15]
MLASFVFILLVYPALGNSQITQTFNLRTGWNAVFLEVQPDPRTPGDVFKDIKDDVESVWAWIDPGATIEYIVDPGEEDWNEAGWHVYFSEESKESFLTNLYAIFANTAYLIKMKKARTLTLSGNR